MQYNKIGLFHTRRSSSINTIWYLIETVGMTVVKLTYLVFMKVIALLEN